jgi:hypothetical protein
MFGTAYGVDEVSTVYAIFILIILGLIITLVCTALNNGPRMIDT